MKKFALEHVEIDDPRAREAYELFLSVHGADTPASLMDISRAAVRHMEKEGLLPQFDRSGEGGPCRIRVTVDTETGPQPWLLSVGGDIRSLLAARVCVFQAIRVTGSTDPRVSPGKTVPSVTAAGEEIEINRLGVPTGLARRIIHPAYAGGPMEAVMAAGAAPARHIARGAPRPGDAVLLLGGADGSFGTGDNGAPPEEHRLLRLFRKERAARLVKRCAGFVDGWPAGLGGPGGGFRVYLDRVPGRSVFALRGRLAVVVAPEDASSFCLEADKENLSCVMIAELTDENRLTIEPDEGKDSALFHSADDIKAVPVHIKRPSASPRSPWEDSSLSPSERLLLLVSDLNFCSQQGLTELFDASVGAGSVLAPHGGLAGAAPEQVAAALIPAPGSRTASVMSCAFVPDCEDPFGSAVFSVAAGAAKLVAAGCAPQELYLAPGDCFPRSGDGPDLWERSLAAVLGTFWAQMGLSAASCAAAEPAYYSPFPVCFAFAVAPAARILPSHFVRHGGVIHLMEAPLREDGLPDLAGLRAMWERLYGYVLRGAVLSAYACEMGGAAGALAHMSLSGLGVRADPGVYDDGFFTAPRGSIVFESPQALEGERVIGIVQQKPEIRLGNDFIPIDSLYAAWWKPLESVFPTEAPAQDTAVPSLEYIRRAPPPVHLLNARPLAAVPVFPGTTGEYDTAAALEAAGALTETTVIRDMRPDWLDQAADALEKSLRKAQILVLPGGFSDGGPDGAGAFIAAFLRDPRLSDAVRDLLHRRGGLVLGVGDGFSALIRLGLVPYGDVCDTDGDCPALTRNAIGQYRSRYVHTRVSSVLSPWLMRCAPGEIHTVPVSHAEGRFEASGAMLESLVRGGQVAFQYCDVKGNPNMATFINPFGSMLAAEGITSLDGRVLGKMAHPERAGFYVGKNVPGNKQQPVFEGGVRYFR
ncbi:MAG: phosphoribosylformylglycinamidine synthase subunit PurQ [Oscillospiraceae bacterium]|jgi:phosphoribosylformylglycinamidine synthase|nr:phosphoribosylformylglycinamidine synthase subunit PurQ [Oscillospiraceae bacterium]